MKIYQNKGRIRIRKFKIYRFVQSAAFLMNWKQRKSQTSRIFVIMMTIVIGVVIDLLYGRRVNNN